jgi:hypothetical protein
VWEKREIFCWIENCLGGHQICSLGFFLPYSNTSKKYILHDAPQKFMRVKVTTEENFSLSHSFSHSFCEFYNENFCWVEKKGETNFYDDMNNNKLIISFFFKGESWILRVFEMIYLWDHQKKKCLFEFLKNILLIPCWAITCTYIALFTILYRSSCRILLLFPMWMSHTSNSQEMKYVFLWLYDSSTFHFWIYLAQASSTSQSKIDLSFKNFHNISLLAFQT